MVLFSCKSGIFYQLVCNDLSSNLLKRVPFLLEDFVCFFLSFFVCHLYCFVRVSGELLLRKQWYLHLSLFRGVVLFFFFFLGMV